VKPERLEDMIAVNALFRPGPLGSGMVDDYVKRKHGRQKVSYVHPKLAPVLEETYGVMAYQEQVMQISSALAGFTMSQADVLLNAMRKKVVEQMATQREDFLTGCAANGIPKKTAVKVFDQMEFFSGYGFNKPHSACYAVLAVRTAYLKTHFAPEFMAATLTSEMDNPDRVVILTGECRRLGIRVLPPDVNEGHVGFRATPRGDIQFGLSAVKNVGRSAVKSIVAARREHGSFEDIFDVTSRVDLRLVNRRVLESLVAAGALDGLHGHRAQQYQVVSAALDLGQRMQRERDSGQTSLMDILETDAGEDLRPRKLPEAAPWSDGVALAKEKEILGMYVSGHPLARYEKELQTFATASTADLPDMEDGEPVRLGGIVTHVKTTADRKGEQMAFVTLEDFSGSVELVVFSSIYGKKSEVIRRDAAVIVDGKVSTREDEEPKVIAADVVTLAGAHGKFVERMTISISSVGFEETMLESLRDLLLTHGGRCPVDIVVKAASGEDVMISTGGIRVEPSRELLDRLEDIVGESGVALAGSVATARVPDPGF
jgi:DNA polymerase-3 subunit alpha